MSAGWAKKEAPTPPQPSTAKPSQAAVPTTISVNLTGAPAPLLVEESLAMCQAPARIEQKLVSRAALSNLEACGSAGIQWPLVADVSIDSYFQLIDAARLKCALAPNPK